MTVTLLIRNVILIMAVTIKKLFMNDLEQEVYDYLDGIPNFDEVRRESIIARIAYELDALYSEVEVIVAKWVAENYRTKSN